MFHVQIHYSASQAKIIHIQKGKKTKLLIPMLSFNLENIPLLKSGLKIHVLKCLLYILDYFRKTVDNLKGI